MNNKINNLDKFLITIIICFSSFIDGSKSEIMCFCNSPPCISTNYMCKSQKQCYSQLLLQHKMKLAGKGEDNERNGDHLYGCIEDLDLTDQHSTIPKSRDNGIDWYSLFFFCTSDLCNTLKESVKGTPDNIMKFTAANKNGAPKITEIKSSDFFVDLTGQPPPVSPLDSAHSDPTIPPTTTLESVEGANPADPVRSHTHSIKSHSPWHLRVVVVIVSFAGVVIICGLVYLANLILDKESNTCTDPFSSQNLKKAIREEEIKSSSIPQAPLPFLRFALVEGDHLKWQRSPVVVRDHSTVIVVKASDHGTTPVANATPSEYVILDLGDGGAALCNYDG